MPSFRPVTSAGVTRSSAAVSPARKRLAHMRDIEQPGLLAGVQMLFQDAGGILHRHLIAGERHHLAAQLQMQGVKRRAAQIFRRIGHHGPDSKSRAPVWSADPFCHGT